jgi:hypothetical protein
MRKLIAASLVALAAVGWAAAAQDTQLPGSPTSVKFAVIGDNGTGAAAQYEVGRQMLEMAVVALATSSGFTFALFMATGLIATGPLLAELKLGALSTVVAALITIGTARLLRVGRFAASKVR